MNIVVCVKQVPDTAEIRIDPVTSTLIRDGVPSIMNPYDKSAVETALELKEAYGGKVTVLTMGLPQAEAVLKEAIVMGADEVALVSDRPLGGSDTLATSYALAKAVEHTGSYDLVLCGQEAIDGETGQVGPEMASHLDLPLVTGVRKVTLVDGELEVLRETETARQTIGVTLPAVVTVFQSVRDPRIGSIKNKMRARRTKVPVWDCATLGIDTSLVGLKGSPTRVVKVFTPPVPEIKAELIDGKNAEEAVEKLVERLVAAKVLQK